VVSVLLEFANFFTKWLQFMLEIAMWPVLPLQCEASSFWSLPGHCNCCIPGSHLLYCTGLRAVFASVDSKHCISDCHVL